MNDLSRKQLARSTAQYDVAMASNDIPVESLAGLVKQMERAGYALAQNGESAAASSLFYAVASLEKIRTRAACHPSNFQDSVA
ncbi:MAG: hypothetical protein ACSHW1_07645 [Yoonia sp.]|uniref:hypothetical protein n=1 Tax=Yoonia sp. TaxID=2212373 RepID=UPI003EF9DB3B